MTVREADTLSLPSCRFGLGDTGQRLPGEGLVSRGPTDVSSWHVVGLVDRGGGVGCAFHRGGFHVSGAHAPQAWAGRDEVMVP